MIEVTLTVDVLQWLLSVADARNRDKSRSQSRHVLEDRYGDLVIDYLGVKGEYVASQIYGVSFDVNGYGRAGDTGVDICTPTPGAVKTNHRTGGYLLVERWRDIANVKAIHLVDGPCDPPRRCLCSDLSPQRSEVWRYVGWITPDRFKAVSTFANWGLGPRRFCRQRELVQELHADALQVS